MSAEAKFYPSSNTERITAIRSAWNTNNQPVFADVLTPATQARLNLVKPDYENKLRAFSAYKAAQATHVAEKEKAKNALAIYVSHFIQSLNLSIARGEKPAAVRAIYSLEVSSEKVPSLLQESEIIYWARNLITGEAARIAAGGVPMSNPSIGDVQLRQTTYLNLVTSTLIDKSNLKKARNEIKKVTVEVNRVIRKVWNEVETYYGERARPSMRRYARRWGVVYARKGATKKLRGIVVDMQSGEMLAAVEIKFANGRNRFITSNDGQFIISTTLMKTQKLHFTCKGYTPVIKAIKLIEGQGTYLEVPMQRVAE
ncbi:MAG: hypothetical protein IPP77_14730 [Bacteroidetes bacterium]|nr:hypothetical protein [Bacteroidota bacterium]